MDHDLQRSLWVAIANGRIRREQLRVELEATPRIRWRRRRQLHRELERTIRNLKGFLSLAGEPRKENPWIT